MTLRLGAVLQYRWCLQAAEETALWGLSRGSSFDILECLISQCERKARRRSEKDDSVFVDCTAAAISANFALALHRSKRLSMSALQNCENCENVTKFVMLFLRICPISLHR